MASLSPIKWPPGDTMTRGTGRGGSSAAPRSVDVARLAGVSQKTVSRVFNDEPYVCVDVPVLVIGAPPPVTAPTVLTAGNGADLMARTATEHLLDLGHMTVHHLAGPQRWYAARDRLEGWQAALTGQGRQVPPVVAGDW